jgi:hypothetical protein
MCSPKTPRLLSYLIGDKVNIVTLRKDQAMAIREEYHAFRKRAVWVMGVAPMLLYLGMKRADYVVEEGASLTLAPPLLTGGFILACLAAVDAAGWGSNSGFVQLLVMGTL